MKRVCIQNDKANPSVWKKAQAQQVLPDIVSHTTPLTNQLIVIESHHQKSELQGGMLENTSLTSLTF